MSEITMNEILAQSDTFDHFRQKVLAAGEGPWDDIRARSEEREICRLMAEVGVPDHLSGYRFIRQALRLALRDRTVLRNITGRLYPAIAREFGTRPCRVERAIRHAVEQAFDRCDPDTLFRYFGNTISAKTGKITNGQFLARLANLLREEM